MKALAATSLNGVIGNNGSIPWKCSSDLKWFKNFTMGETLVMGRKTFEGLPYLPGRNIIVLSKGVVSSPVIGRYEPHELIITNNLDSIPRTAIIAGGAQVYELLMPKCTELYLTVIKQTVEGDTFFPAFRRFFTKEELLENTSEKFITRFYN